MIYLLLLKEVHQLTLPRSNETGKFNIIKKAKKNERKKLSQVQNYIMFLQEIIYGNFKISFKNFSEIVH